MSARTWNHGELVNPRDQERHARRVKRAECLERLALDAYRHGLTARGRRLEALYFRAKDDAHRFRWETYFAQVAA